MRIAGSWQHHADVMVHDPKLLIDEEAGLDEAIWTSSGRVVGKAQGVETLTHENTAFLTTA